MKLTAFTCLVGDTPDELRAPTVVNPAVRYVVLADRDVSVAPYECVRVADELGLGGRLLSRRIKILADHPALGAPDVTLWHDAAFRLDCDPIAVAAQALEPNVMLALRHPHRDQIEDEAHAIARHGYAPLDRLLAQAASYRREGFRQSAITSTGFCLRRHTPQVMAFNRIWWSEVLGWCWRDQMSVDYSLWRAGLAPTYIEGHYKHNPFAKWFPPSR